MSEFAHSTRFETPERELAERWVDASIQADEAAEVAIPRMLEVYKANIKTFSQFSAFVLNAFADRDRGIEEIPKYIEANQERWICDEDKPQVRLALAAAYLRSGDSEFAQTTFFEAGILSNRQFRPEDLTRINDFIYEWVRYKLRPLAVR